MSTQAQALFFNRKITLVLLKPGFLLFKVQTRQNFIKFSYETCIHAVEYKRYLFRKGVILNERKRERKKEQKDVQGIKYEKEE